ncbi:xylulokinase [Rhizosphaericola mali]|uniref:Carbohydrate kinase n=1 Tax=Rhizosphaericola mali TaxID=2545455 RepID=A0A5P2G3T7_9BACT|nr:FGGY family carbohydrate kinase [Rhizosphaericola mali]QES90145.1 carbohydrate kinase [Rhizosphaericola mali]
MFILGIDLGTSFVKLSIYNIENQQTIAAVTFPETEVAIEVLHPDWAEQDPEIWWKNICDGLQKLQTKAGEAYKQIKAIGIAYQMHGLVCVDAQQNVLRKSIIWCDSRSIDIGNQAFASIGKEKCLEHLLNSPGNFTASKLKWVKENEPDLFEKIDKIMLPGDFIAMKFTGEITTSIAALSEGIFWDFKTATLSKDILEYYGFSENLIPTIQEVFSEHGRISKKIAETTGLKEGIPITYKAGDQPNNALSLNVFKPGEFAATAGTSGVIYGISDQLIYDSKSRINSFAHVNHTTQNPRIGILLNINGVGIANSWIKKIASKDLNYEQMNHAAAEIPIGSEQLSFLPFGNGAERMLENKILQAHLDNIQFNVHKPAHIYRSVQEGIACAFKYGMKVILENGITPKIIKAAYANMFLSEVFAQTFVNLLEIPVELYKVDGSVGSAIGAAYGAKIFTSLEEAFQNQSPNNIIEPQKKPIAYENMYYQWEHSLSKYL